MRIVPEEGDRLIDIEKFHKYLTEVYRYRGLNDPKVVKDENTTGLLVNYPEKFIELAGNFLTQADTNKASELLNKSKEIYPEYWRTYVFLSQIYTSQNKTDLKNKILAEGENYIQKMTEKNPDNLLYFQYLGLMQQMQDKTEEALVNLRKAYKMSSSNIVSYRAMLGIYMSKNRTLEAMNLVENWLKHNPTDQFSLNLLQQLRLPSPAS